MAQLAPLFPNVDEVLRNLPLQPGVYLMKDAQGGILYVGKAKRLRLRVRSYFTLSGIPSHRILTMVSQIADLEYIVTDSEIEALILESTLIKKHKPPYNVMLKDDKNFPYIKLTLHEEFPRVTTVRKVTRDGALYFGPYVKAGAMQKTLKLIKRLFPLRLCSGNVTVGSRERPCFEYEIHRCPGVCAGKCTKAAYWETVEEVKLFLQGKKDELLGELRQRMQAHADRLEFEQAARLRDQIQSVEHVMQRQKIVSTHLENQDVLATARQGMQVALQIFFVRNGILLGRKAFNFSELAQGNAQSAGQPQAALPEAEQAGRAETLDQQEVLRAFVEQYYVKDVLIPDEILLPAAIPNQDMLAEWLSDRKGKKVSFVIPQRGRKRQLLAMAQQNAKLALEAQEAHDPAAWTPILEELQQQFGLRALPRRIECFDISNIQGALAVGSMVVCEHGLMQPSAYKRFRIKTVEGSDDFAMMQEVITRRYSRLQREDKPFPDLIMVDGGKGQLHAAHYALYALKLTTLDVVGIAKAHGPKGSERDIERIFTSVTGDGIVLDTSRKSAQLLQRIRDEAHRFAITYHRALRKKANLHSILEEIPGVGQKRRKRLLTHFGSLKNLKAATLDEIAATPTIPGNLAETIYAFLHATHTKEETQHASP